MDSSAFAESFNHIRQGPQGWGPPPPPAPVGPSHAAMQPQQPMQAYTPLAGGATQGIPMWVVGLLGGLLLIVVGYIVWKEFKSKDDDDYDSDDEDSSSRRRKGRKKVRGKKQVRFDDEQPATVPSRVQEKIAMIKQQYARLAAQYQREHGMSEQEAQMRAKSEIQQKLITQGAPMQGGGAPPPGMPAQQPVPPGGGSGDDDFMPM